MCFVRSWCITAWIMFAATPAFGVVLAEFDFSAPANGDMVTNLGVGPDGQLLNGATVSDGVLNIDGLGSGLDIPFAALNPFGGTADWSVQFDFSSEDEGGGPLFSSDNSACPDECNVEEAEGSLNIFLTDAGEVRVDAWFIDSMGSGEPLNDGELHNVLVTYTAEEGLWELFIDGDEDPVESGEWPYERNAVADRTRVGDQTNPDFGFEDIDPGMDGIVASIDNLVIEAPSPPPVVATIDRATGEISLENIQPGFNFNSLSVFSPSGSLEQTRWMPIAGNLDAAGDGSLDADDNWTVGERSSMELTEMADGDGATLAEGQTFSLGEGVWQPSPLEDIRIALFDTELDESVRGAVAYSGDAVQLGDLNLDGVLNSTDWDLFVDQFGSLSLAELTGRERYFAADLNGDGLHDAEDFIEFSIAYDEVNGEGAFAAMSSVPEPSSVGLLSLGGLLLLRVRRRRAKRACTLTPSTRHAAFLTLLLGVLTFSVAARPAHAELLAEYLFDANENDSSGNNRHGRLDEGIFGEGQPAVRNGRLVLTGEPGEGMEIPLGDANPFDGSQDFTIDLTFNVGLNEDETGYLLLGSANDNDPALPDNHSMAIFLNDEGSVVYDNYFVGDVVVEGTDYRDEEDHQVRIAYTAPEDPEEDGRMFIRVDGVWLGAGEIQPAVPDIADHAVFLGTSLNEDFPFECEEVCFVRELEGTIDDVRIYDESFEPSQMSVEVDRATGDVKLLGGEFVRDVQYYEIRSESGSLRASAWGSASLDAQNVDALGEGSGQSWDVLTASNERAVEAYLLGSSEFDADKSVTLAQAWGGEADLEVEIVTTDHEVFSIDVRYVGEGTGAAGSDLDCNGDGVVSVEDFACSNAAGVTEALIGDLGLLQGDLDGQDGVGFADFLVLSDNFSQAGTYAQGDLDGDGMVGFPDFLILSDNFGKSSVAAQGVPEPAGLSLLFGGVTLVGALRRRRR